MDEDELRGVLAHELMHIKNRDILIGSVAAAIAIGITFLARMVMWGAMFGGSSDDEGGGGILGLLAMAILAPVAAMLLQMALSRSREFEADRTGGASHRRRRTSGSRAREARAWRRSRSR